jgi:hypothetical protein
MQGLAGFGKCHEAVMNHAPDIAEHDFHAAHEVAQPLDKPE